MMNNITKHFACMAAVAAGLAGPTGAAAADANGNFALRGYGSRTCQVFNAEFPDAKHSANYGSWLMGYVSARNRVESETFDILPLLDGMVLLQAVSTVCKDQPTITVESAANEVIRAIAPLHQRSETSIVVVENDGRKIAIREGMLSALQVRLVELGMYSGPVDGQWTTSLAAAVKTFQMNKNITATGLPDLATLLRALVLN